jgi:hypothetical protein
VGLLAGGPLSAQEAAVPAERSKGGQEQFRADFLRFTDVFARAALRAGDKGRAAQILHARQLMKAAPAEELARMAKVGPLPDLKPLIEAAIKLDQQLTRASEARALASPVQQRPGFPDRPAILGACDAIVHDSQTTFAFLVVEQAADVILAAAGRICDEVVVLVGEGGNTSLICLPFEIALTAAKIPFALADFCGGEEDSSYLEGNYNRLAHIHDDLEAEAASIRSNDNTNAANIISNDNSNTANIISNDNTNATNIVNNDNANRDILVTEIQASKGEIIAEIQGLACELIRLVNTPEGRRSSDILSCATEPGYPYDFPEAPLARGASSARGGAGRPNLPVSLMAGRAYLDAQLLEGRMAPSLYLPAEQGGMIEQVKALVWQAIEAHGNLGINKAAAARDAATHGDALLAGKQYVAAYKQYSKAYRSLLSGR